MGRPSMFWLLLAKLTPGPLVIDKGLLNTSAPRSTTTALLSLEMTKQLLWILSVIDDISLQLQGYFPCMRENIHPSIHLSIQWLVYARHCSWGWGSSIYQALKISALSELLVQSQDLQNAAGVRGGRLTGFQGAPGQRCCVCWHLPPAP